jgi:flagellar basal-body rod protein FlgB
MGISFFEKGSYDALKSNLDGTHMRGKLIANNIANQNTPSYVAKDMNFKMYMKMASEKDQGETMEVTNGSHIDTESLRTQNPDEFTRSLTDQMFINRVETSQEEEMVKLAENSITFRASSDLISRNYSILSTAITGGSR